MLAALSIFLLTLVLVIWQPRGLGIGYSALGGAALALATGVIHLSDIPTVWHIIWDATFTFVGLIVVSLILDEAGFFHWAALHVARLGSGRGRLLLPLVVVLGAVISALFANDGAALILTPIVLSMLLALGLTPQATLAFVMACGFVADTTSLPLVISNLVNIVTAEYFRIPFDRYAAVMLPVDLAALAATLLVLAVYFRRDIPRHYAVDELPPPRSAVKDAVVFRWAFPSLAVLLLAYFFTAAYAVPVSLVTGLAAAVMLALAGRWWPGAGAACIDVRGVLRHAPWQIVLFSLGMYLVIYGLRNAGLTAELAGLLELLGRHGVMASAVGTGLISALLSSVMNNLPMTLIGALGIHQAQGLPPQVRDAMIYAHVIGCDLGPKFTPIGSLATLLWLHVLERKGMRIGWGYYIHAGLLLTTPVLLLTLLALALRLG